MLTNVELSGVMETVKVLPAARLTVPIRNHLSVASRSSGCWCPDLLLPDSTLGVPEADE